MKDFKKDFKRICREEKGILILMVLNFLISIGLFVFAVINIHTDAPIVKVGYGDIGGYRDGAWSNLLVFPVTAVLFGVLHNLLAFKVFQKRGAGLAKFFLLITTLLIIGAYVVLIRLLEEG